MIGPLIANLPRMRPVRILGATIVIGAPAVPASIGYLDWDADAAERAAACDRLRRLDAAADRIIRRRSAQDQANAMGIPLADPAAGGPVAGPAALP